MKQTLFLLLFIPLFATGQTITTFAGNNIAGESGDGGPATVAEMQDPASVAVDKHGNVFISDQYNNLIRKVDTFGIITSFAGMGTHGFYGEGVPASTATFEGNYGLTFDKYGNLYVAEFSYGVVRKIDTFGIIRTYAGNRTNGYSGDGGPATNAQLGPFEGVSVDTFGNVYIPDTWNHAIRKVSTSGIITTIAGGHGAGFSGDGGPATLAKLNCPNSVSVDVYGNMYIADWNNQRVRKVNPSGIISTYAGNGTSGYSGDGGPATAAELSAPRALESDKYGNLYLAESNNNLLRLINSSGIISTLAGTGIAGYSGDGGPATAAQLHNPIGLRLTKSGYIYIADDWNNVVRKLKLSILPIDGNSVICQADSAVYTDEVAGGTWTSRHPAIAVIGATSGRLNALTAGLDTLVYTIGSYSVTKAITVNPTPALTSTLTPPAICDTATFHYTASSSIPGTIITWSRPLVTGITDPPASGSGALSEILINTSTHPVAVPYTFTLTSGGCSVNVVVTVTVDPMPFAGSITGTLVVCQGNTVSLTETATGGWWSSLNPALASVGSGTGIVTGLSAGTDTIVYSVSNLCGMSSARSALTILSPGHCDSMLKVIQNLHEDNTLFRLFPNPTGSLLDITSTSGQDKIDKVTIFTITGKTMFCHEYGKTEAQVDLSGFANGLYIVVINEHVVSRFLKE